MCLSTDSSFTLSAGQASNFYFDCKKAMLDGECIGLIADEFLEEIAHLPDRPTSIGGLTMGADFIVAAVIQRSHETRKGIIKGSVVRKEPKKHGTRNFIENQLPAGTKIVVVDDVITSGKSTAQACKEFMKADYEIVGIVALVDREAGGKESLEAEFDCPVRAIFKKSDFPRLADGATQSEGNLRATAIGA